MKFLRGCLIALLVACLLVVIGVPARYKWANIQPVVHFPAPVPTPSPNGFDLYLAAESRIKAARPPLDERYDPTASSLSPAQKAERYSLARRRAWVNQNSQAFDLFKIALAAEARTPNTRGVVDPVVPYGKIRQLARDKVVQSKMLEMEGHWREALDSRLDVIEMGEDAERGGSLVPSLLGIACQAIALDDAGRLVSHLSATECRALNARLQKIIAARSPFAAILQEEKYSSQAMLLNAWAKGDAQRKTIFIPTPRAVLLSLLSTRRSFVAGNEAMMNAFIAQADKPFRLQKPVPEPNLLFDHLNDILYPVLNRALFNFTRSLAGPQGLQLQLALRAYRLEKGAYPAGLQQLVPAYLSKVPVDPYGSGQTWLYQKKGDSYLAWSIGPDGKNDGGKPVLLKKGSKRVVVWTDSIGDVTVKP